MRKLEFCMNVTLLLSVSEKKIYSCNFLISGAQDLTQASTWLRALLIRHVRRTQEAERVTGRLPRQPTFEVRALRAQKMPITFQIIHGQGRKCFPFRLSCRRADRPTGWATCGHNGRERFDHWNWLGLPVTRHYSVSRSHCRSNHTSMPF
jgi:hypothetical protein